MAAGAGLYVHVPFCASRCAYCAFYSQTDLGLRGAWLAALEREATAWRGRFPRFDTLYVGGGTPTLLGAAGLARVAAVARDLGVPPEAERTVEANPDDLTPALARALREEGFNRVSLGIQTFRDPVLRRLGRRHDAAGARRAVAAAHEAGFTEVSLDLIQGLPGEGPREARRDLAAALALGPTHLSIYELTVEPGTPLAGMVARGAVRLPGEEALRRRFLERAETLEGAGWDHYEVSSFARTPAHRARHNRKYWRHAPWLGLGPGAHSYDGDRTRWWNPRDLGAYLGRLQAGGAPEDGREVLHDEDLRLERLALGFRTSDGVARGDLAGREEAVSAAVARGLLVRDGDRIRPTREGLLFADRLAVDLA